SLRRTTPRGATVTVRPHSLHAYRRTPTVPSCGGCPSAAGPRCDRERLPCPCIWTPPPGGRLGAPHAGQHAGRALSQPRICALHSSCLLPVPASSILDPLRSFTRSVGA